MIRIALIFTIGIIIGYATAVAIINGPFLANHEFGAVVAIICIGGAVVLAFYNSLINNFIR